MNRIRCLPYKKQGIMGLKNATSSHRNDQDTTREKDHQNVQYILLLCGKPARASLTHPTRLRRFS